MRTSSIPGFDLREAVDGLRDAFTPRAPEAHDIRAAILQELATEPMHGYQLIQAIEARSGGTFSPSAGVVYPTLQLLADEGLVTAAQVGERKVYTLTDAGRAAAAAVPTEPAEPAQPRRTAPAAVSLTKSGMKLASALTQVATNGTAEQSERAAAIIDETRRKLYAILAED